MLVRSNIKGEPGKGATQEHETKSALLKVFFKNLNAMSFAQLNHIPARDAVQAVFSGGSPDLPVAHHKEIGGITGAHKAERVTGLFAAVVFSRRLNRPMTPSSTLGASHDHSTPGPGDELQRHSRRVHLRPATLRQHHLDSIWHREMTILTI